MQQFFVDMVQNPWPNIFAGLAVWVFTECLSALWRRRTDWQNWSSGRKRAQLEALYQRAKEISLSRERQISWAAGAIMAAIWNSAMLVSGFAGAAIVVGMVPAAPEFELGLKPIITYVAMFCSAALALGGLAGLSQIYWKFHKEAKAIQSLPELEVEVRRS